MSVATQTVATKPNIVPIFREDRLVSLLQAGGTHLTRYSLVLVFLWIGGMKFTNAFEQLPDHGGFGRIGKSLGLVPAG